MNCSIVYCFTFLDSLGDTFPFGSGVAFVTNALSRRLRGGLDCGCCARTTTGSTRSTTAKQRGRFIATAYRLARSGSTPQRRPCLKRVLEAVRASTPATQHSTPQDLPTKRRTRCRSALQSGTADRRETGRCLL